MFNKALPLVAIVAILAVTPAVAGSDWRDRHDQRKVAVRQCAYVTDHGFCLRFGRFDTVRGMMWILYRHIPDDGWAHELPDLRSYGLY